MDRGIFVIAEAGVNHNGDTELAVRMIDTAAEAGADAVKFQTFRADRIISRHARKAEYQKKTTGADESQLEMVKKLELNGDAHAGLMERCRKKGIMFLSTPFDFESIDLLNGLGMEIFKIPSGEITNLPYLRRVGGLRKRIILSTGMSTLGEVETALDILVSAGTARDDITVLHCTTEYPAPLEEVNLRAMLTMGDALKVKVGYSDHTPGIVVPVAAAAMGACVIEKHFTLDKNMPGPDHKASLEPDELRKMVEAIRTVESALGDGIKRPSLSEAGNRIVARKSIVAARKIGAGERFTGENLIPKRPGSGISPMLWDSVIGRTASRDFEDDELIVI